MFEHCLYFNTSALARRLDREWTAAFAPFALTPPQGFMLRAILERPGLLHRELASLLSIARPTATRALDGLMQRGLIERRPSSEDARESSIHPTRAAEALRDPLNEASARVTRRLKRVLSDGAFIDAVARVRDVRTALE